MATDSSPLLNSTVSSLAIGGDSAFGMMAERRFKLTVWELLLVITIVALYACVFASLATILILDIVILVEFLGISKLRKTWQFPAALILFSAVAGLVWTTASVQYYLLTAAMLAFASLPIVKLAYCWHEDAMPKNRIYEIALRLTFPSCSLLGVFLFWGVLERLRNVPH